MSKIKTLAKLATVVALGATAASAGTREIHKYGEFFQNVKAEHVQPLLGGAAFVSHVDYEGIGERAPSGGGVNVHWFTTEGDRYTCLIDIRNGNTYNSHERKYRGEDFVSKYLRTQVALMAILDGAQEDGYQHVFYDGSTGGMTLYQFYNLRLWEMTTGHLQSELPAVTWELCPDFPSAKSLGARVNKKQTAKHYFDLIKQDPGKRVLKPEYEAKTPPIVRLDLDLQPMPGQGDR